MAVCNWYLYVCGINHKTSAITDRESLQISREEMPGSNSTLSAQSGVMEAAIVSTCNRVELYFVADKAQAPFEIVKSFYQKTKGLDISSLEQYYYIKRSRQAAEHLFRVAAGIDSMVLGENHIVGQLKEAYSSACLVKSTGKVLHRLFHQAFRVGKQVRSDTEMGKGACSVSGAAIELLSSKLDQFEKPTILFIGINQMISLAASSLSTFDDAKFIFANRTTEKAVEFAAKYDGKGYSLDELPALLQQADIVITCTGSQIPIITAKMLVDLRHINPSKKMIILDLANPRDVEADGEGSQQIEIQDLDSIRKFLDDRQQKMQAAIPQAEEIINRKLEEFLYWYNHVRHEPLYNGLDRQFEFIRQEELDSILLKLPPELQNEFNAATRRLINRLLQMKMRTAPESNQENQ
jgi:glutamyl-tRNA reductase